MKKKQLGLIGAITLLMGAQVVASDDQVNSADNTKNNKVTSSAQSAGLMAIALRGAALTAQVHGKDAVQAVKSKAQSLVLKGKDAVQAAASKGFLNLVKVAGAYGFGLKEAHEVFYKMNFEKGNQSEKLMKTAQYATRFAAATLAFFINKKIVEMGLSNSKTTKQQIGKFIALVLYFYYLSPELKRTVHILWNKFLIKYASDRIKNALLLKKLPEQEIQLLAPAASQDFADAIVYDLI